MAHKGKASEVTFNPDDPPTAYTNPVSYNRITAYTQGGKEKYGPEWDPAAAPLDGDVIMRVGGGKKHGRYAIANSSVDPLSTSTLSQIRAMDTGSSGPAIRPRETVASLQVQQLQVISDICIIHQILMFIYFAS